MPFYFHIPVGRYGESKQPSPRHSQNKMGAIIYNSDLSRELQDGAKIQVSRDRVPNELAEKVIPVMEVNPKMLRRCNVAASGLAANSAASTVYTSPSDKDFYLVAMALSTIKDATSTSTAARITSTINGASVSLLSIASATLTAQADSTSLTLPIPLKIDRGTSIAVTNTTADANVSTRASIFGYTDDLVKA